MSITRKMLKAMGIEDDKAEQIIEAHTETIEGLKSYKADAEKLSEVQAQLDAANTALEAAKNDGWQGRYNTLKGEFDAYKGEVEASKLNAAREKAYRAVLAAAGISEKRIDSVVKVSADVIDGIELTADGTAKDSAQLIERAKGEWADFISVPTTTGAPVASPPTAPTVDYDSMSDAEYYAATKKG